MIKWDYLNMYKAEECISCGNRRLEEFLHYPAVISPFIAAYVLKTQAALTYLLECNHCSCRFFAMRFNEIEIGDLYRNYRGEQYFQIRHQYEFWYSKKINDSIGHDVTEIQRRQHRVKNYLKDKIDVAAINTVLDFGGDKGQFIPADLGKERYVFEISGVESVAGVTVIASEPALMQQQFDFIMLCHVLEHYSNPSDCLDNIKKIAKKNESVVFIELPYERYDLRFVTSHRFYKKYLQWIIQFKRLFSVFDFFSTTVRLKLNFIPPLGFMRLHEHISFFNEKSLTALLEKNGFSIIHCDVIAEKSVLGNKKVLVCLARVASVN